MFPNIIIFVFELYFLLVCNIYNRIKIKILDQSRPYQVYSNYWALLYILKGVIGSL